MVERKKVRFGEKASARGNEGIRDNKPDQVISVVADFSAEIDIGADPMASAARRGTIDGTITNFVIRLPLKPISETMGQRC
jgi:hypothetical protein